MAIIPASLNRASSQLTNVCDLCWEGFDSVEELAAHVEQEEWTLYPVGVAE